MSWDIILFNSRQKIKTVEDLDENCLEPTDFCVEFEKYFENILSDDNHREIKGANFSIDYFLDDEPVSNKMLSLYGENALYQLILLARKCNWQIYDTGMEGMIDLEKPTRNGYENFQSYLKQVITGK